MEVMQIVTSFGPIAFGTAVLIVLWKVIVKPELDSRKLEMQAMSQMIQSMGELHHQIKSTARTQSASVDALTALVESQRAMLRELRELANEQQGG